MRPSSSRSTTPNGDRTWETTIVAAAPVRSCSPSERGEVDVEQLVAVEREHRSALLPPRGRELQAAAAAERLGLPHRLDLGAEACERVHEHVLLAGAARDDDARDAGSDEAADGVLGERIAGHRDERLGQALRGLPHALRLAAREEQRLHQTVTGEACLGRPIPS